LIASLKNGDKLIETNDKVAQVAWSPDETKIAYSVENNSNKSATAPWELVYDLFIANADGSNLTKIISNGEFIIRDFSFSSDNKMILYIKGIFGSDPHDELWVINSDGSNDRKVDSGTGFGKLYTTPYGNLAIYSKALSGIDRYVYYWLNLDTLSREVFSEDGFIFSLKFLAN